MSALFIAPRVPMVDVKTGIPTPIWYRFFSSLFGIAGGGAIDDSVAFQVEPFGSGDALIAMVSSLSDNLMPPVQVTAAADDYLIPASQTYFFAADDIAPLIGSLRDEIAMLRGEIDNLKQGGVTL